MLCAQMLHEMCHTIENQLVAIHYIYPNIGLIHESKFYSSMSTEG